MARNFRIALDFDGTLVHHRYPDVGKTIDGAVYWIKRLHHEFQVKYILWTVRDGMELGNALLWWHDATEIELYGVNENPSQKEWSLSPKAHADVFVDDMAYGCPLIYPLKDRRPYVDWSQVGPGLYNLASTHARAQK